MTREQILEKIRGILSDVLGEDDLALTEKTVADEVENWDSVNHVKLLIGLEADLGIQFEAEEVSAAENVGQLIDVIQRKLKT